MKSDCTHICGIRSWFGEISRYLSLLLGRGRWFVGCLAKYRSESMTADACADKDISISCLSVILRTSISTFSNLHFIALVFSVISLHFVCVCHYIFYLCVIVFYICLSLYFVFVCLCILYFCVIDFCISGLGTGWSLYWLSGRSSQPRLDFLHKRLRPRRRPSISWCNLAEIIFVFLYSLFCISALFICLCNRDFLSWSPFCTYSQKLIMSEICTVTLSSAEQMQNTTHSKLKNCITALFDVHLTTKIGNALDRTKLSAPQRNLLSHDNVALLVFAPVSIFLCLYCICICVVFVFVLMKAL